MAPIGRGSFHCHRQAAAYFAGRPIDLPPLLPACFLLDDSCNLGCMCNITSGISLGVQTLEELESQVQAICLELFDVMFADEELVFNSSM